VRRLVIAGAVAASLIVAFVFARTIFARATAAQIGGAAASGMGGASGNSNSTSISTSASPSTSASSGAAIVVATGISARALTVHASGPHDMLYYTDPFTPNRVLSLVPGDSGGNLLTAVTGTGAAGFLGDGGAANGAQFDLKLDSLFERSGIAIADDGTMFVADTRNATVRRIAGPESSEPGVVRSVAGRWAPPQNISLVEPLGIALDGEGNLYIADHGANAVVELNAATGQLETLAQVVSPSSIAVTHDGSKVFVASPETGRVISLPVQTRVTTSWQANVQGFEGPSSAEVRGSACNGASSARELCPTGVALDAGGNLFIADANASRLLRIDEKTGAATTFAHGLHSPGELAFDEKGNLYVSDQAKQQIVEFVGAGVSNSVTLSPTSFDFGDEPTGGTTASESFTLTNNSGSTLSGVAISFAGGNTADFVVSSTSCLATLPNAMNCTINVAFAPTDVGARSTTLTVNSSFTSAQTAALSGTGDTYALALAAGQLQTVTVIAGTKATWMMQATNDATFTGTVTLVCPTQLPTLTFCSFTPATLNFTAPSQTIPFTASIMTTSRTPQKAGGAAPSAINQPPAGNLPRFPALAMAFVTGFASFFAIGLCAWLLRHYGATRTPAGILMRASRRRWVSVSALLAALAAAAFAGGCHHHRGVATGTPAGTANLIFQGTAQGATRPVSVILVVK